MTEPKVLYVQRPVLGGVWDFQPADDSEVLAHIRAGVESGTIKGEVLWMIPDEYEHLRGSLWTGPPTDGKGYAVLVIPVSDGGEDRP